MRQHQGEMGDVPPVQWMWACPPACQPVCLQRQQGRALLGMPSATALALGQEARSASLPDQCTTKVFSSPAALDLVIVWPPGLKSILSTSIHRQTAPSASHCPGNTSPGLCLGLQYLGEWSDHHIPVIPV